MLGPFSASLIRGRLISRIGKLADSDSVIANVPSITDERLLQRAAAASRGALRAQLQLRHRRWEAVLFAERSEERSRLDCLGQIREPLRRLDRINRSFRPPRHQSILRGPAGASFAHFVHWWPFAHAASGELPSSANCKTRAPFPHFGHFFVGFAWITRLPLMRTSVRSVGTRPAIPCRSQCSDGRS
jgi:hypothetical protein